MGQTWETAALRKTARKATMREPWTLGTVRVRSSREPDPSASVARLSAMVQGTDEKHRARNALNARGWPTAPVPPEADVYGWLSHLLRRRGAPASRPTRVKHDRTGTSGVEEDEKAENLSRRRSRGAWLFWTRRMPPEWVGDPGVLPLPPRERGERSEWKERQALKGRPDGT